MKTINLFSVKGGVGLTTLGALVALRMAAITPVVMHVETEDEMFDMAVTFGTTPSERNEPIEVNHHHLITIEKMSAMTKPCNLAVSTRPQPGEFHNVLVSGLTYLDMRRVTTLRRDWENPMHGFVTIGQPGQALTSTDAGFVYGEPNVANFVYDQNIARRCDAGMLVTGRGLGDIETSLDAIIESPVTVFNAAGHAS
jgi:hypothetical protein